MTPCDQERTQPDAVIRRLAKLLDAESIAAKTTQPIHQAIQEYRRQPRPVRCQADFLDEVAGFLQHLHERAFPRGRQLTASQARAEVIALLGASGFPGGYEGAYLAASDSTGSGWEEVLRVITEAVMVRTQQAYVHWALTTPIDPLDWDLRTRIASHLIHRIGANLTEALRRCPPEEFADSLPLLLHIASGVGVLPAGNAESDPPP